MRRALGEGSVHLCALPYFFRHEKTARRVCSQPPRRWTGGLTGPWAGGSGRSETFPESQSKGSPTNFSRGPGVASLRRIVAHWARGHFDRHEEGGRLSSSRMHHAPRTGSVDRDPIWPTEQTADQRSRKRSFARAGGVVHFLFDSTIFSSWGQRREAKILPSAETLGFSGRLGGRQADTTTFRAVASVSPFALLPLLSCRANMDGCQFASSLQVERLMAVRGSKIR